MEHHLCCSRGPPGGGRPRSMDVPCHTGGRQRKRPSTEAKGGRARHAIRRHDSCRLPQHKNKSAVGKKEEEAVGRPIGSRSRGQAHIRHTSTPARCCCYCISEWPDGVAIYIWHRTASLPATGRCPVGPQYLGCARGQRDTIAESACLPKLTYDSQPCSYLRPGLHGWPCPEATRAS